MRRLLFLATAYSVLSVVPLSGQSRVPGIPIPGTFFSVAQISPRAGFPVFFRPPIARSPIVRRRVFFQQPFFVPVPFFMGPSYPYEAPSTPVVVQTASPLVDNTGQLDVERKIDKLTEEIGRLREDRLRDEIDRLKEEQTRRDLRESRRERSSPAEEEGTQARGRVQPQAGPSERGGAQGPAIVLAFRNGQRREIRNYAVVGQTLWDLTEDRATRILLSALDPDLTAKLNEDRGLDFHLPSRQDQE